MKKNINNFNIILFFAVIFCASSCGNNLNSTDSLKKYYSSFFNIGAAINEDIILGLDNDSKQIVETQFNSITPENSLKWIFVQPYPNSFNFTVADKYVNIGITYSYLISPCNPIKSYRKHLYISYYDIHKTRLRNPVSAILNVVRRVLRSTHDNDQRYSIL